MKYLKYFNINESLDDARQDLRDIFTDLIDEGYDVDVFKGYDDSGKDEYRATISRSKEIFFFDEFLLKFIIGFITIKPNIV